MNNSQAQARDKSLAPRLLVPTKMLVSRSLRYMGSTNDSEWRRMVTASGELEVPSEFAGTVIGRTKPQADILRLARTRARQLLATGNASHGPGRSPTASATTRSPSLSLSPTPSRRCRVRAESAAESIGNLTARRRRPCWLSLSLPAVRVRGPGVPAQDSGGVTVLVSASGGAGPHTGTLAHTRCTVTAASTGRVKRHGGVPVALTVHWQ